MPRIDPSLPLDLTAYHRETIPEEYLDEMGHMNVRWYVAVYSRGARELFHELGMTTEYFARGKDGSFALEQFIRYLAEVHVGETVAIRSRLLARSEKRLHLQHFMMNETTGTVASTMEVLVAHADLEARRTSPFPAAIAERIDALIARHRELTWEPPLSGAIAV